MSENIDLALIIAVFGAHKTKKIEGRTRIQKISCILKYQDKIPFTFNYKPYYYGPYSDELSEDINTLIGMKLLEENITYTGNGSYRYDYTLTNNASKLLKKLEKSNPIIMGKINKKIQTLEDMRTSNLVCLAKEVSGIQSI
jgi:uncharacterized protein YwgA